MAETKLWLTVFESDGSERVIEIEKGGPATLGNAPGCTVKIDSSAPFMFTLIAWDESRAGYIIHLTDAIKGELFSDGTSKQLGECKRDGTAQGVESLGIWTMELPVPCSGFLAVAGAILHFELGVEARRKSNSPPDLQPANENQMPVEAVCVRRGSR